MPLVRHVKRGLHEFLKCLPARWYLPAFYRRLHGGRLNLARPESFNEKIQWLKLHYRDPLLTRLADKWEVRRYIREMIGERYLNDAIGVFDHPDAIDFEQLPPKFAIKATHGSGWNILCRDKATLDWPAARRQLRQWLKWNHYWMGREWAYKHVRPRLLVEHYLAAANGEPPADYKFFCMSGRPRAVQVDLDRFQAHRRRMLDTDWRPLGCTLKYPDAIGDVPRPASLDEMLAVAAKLSSGLPFVRVDLYDLAGRVVFGEMTFYPGSGVERFDPSDYDRQFGSWIQLPVS